MYISRIAEIIAFIQCSMINNKLKTLANKLTILKIEVTRKRKK